MKSVLFGSSTKQDDMEIGQTEKNPMTSSPLILVGRLAGWDDMIGTDVADAVVIIAIRKS